MRLDAANFVYYHPKGAMYGWFSDKGLRFLELPVPNQRKLPLLHSFVNDHRVWILHEALERYFAGIREDFERVPLDFTGATPFQEKVWRAARNVSWGTVSTYGALAKMLEKPNAARAVGNALGANPLPILVPCHRFLRTDGQLGGFSSGLEWKKELLRVEGISVH